MVNNQQLIEIMDRPDPDKFLKKAKRLVSEDYNLAAGEESFFISPADIYVVWFAKTLQNWKALLSTDAHPGLYWEVTYNGDKQETYIDLYSKASNRVVPDNK